MIGFGGASRYYHPRYQAGFALERRAVTKAREEMGRTNLKLMILFCRTVEEGRRVQAEMEKHEFKRGVNGLELYALDVRIAHQRLSRICFIDYDR